MTALADAHLHLFRDGFRGPYGQIGGEPEAYERFRAAHGIEAGLVVCSEGEGIDPHNNAHVRALAVSRPWITSVAFLRPTAAPAPAVIDGLLRDGHRGIAIYLMDEAAAAAVLDWPAASWRRLEEAGAIVSLNARPAATAALAPLIEARPGCTFLFSHLGLPGRHAQVPTMVEAATRLAGLLDLARLTNVMVKVSGLYAISDPAHAYPHAAAGPFLEVILERFGPSRCCWGSDFSPVLGFLSFAQAVDIPWPDGLTAADRAAIMGGNLLALLAGGPTAAR